MLILPTPDILRAWTYTYQPDYHSNLKILITHLIGATVMNILRCTVADASNVKVQHIFNFHMLKTLGQSLSAVKTVHPVKFKTISED